jgi:hypothetical protein
MKRSLATFGLGALALIGVAAGLATAGLAAEPGPPNQGDPDKVFTVASGYLCSGTLVPGAKVEGQLGPTITVTAATPIVQVTIKSGSKAELATATWSADYLSGTITITQDVSNYAVWTCSGTTTTETTPTTTETTPTTTETTPTTTETTPTTTETTPTTTETTPTTTGTTPATTGTTPTTTTTETAPTVVPAAPLTPPKAPTKPAGAQAPEQTTPTAPLTPPSVPAARSAAGVATTQAQPELAYTP